MSAKNGILAAVIVVVGALAVWRFVVVGSGEHHPDTDETRTHWMCEECGYMVALTAKERDEWTHSDRARPATKRGDKRTVYRCPECGTYTMVRARKCPRHGNWYVETRSDGSYAGCPLCREEEARHSGGG